jgi:cysteinyl-tRNA synthetase
MKPRPVTPEVRKLIKEREVAREEKDFRRSDILRKKAEELGYRIEDTPKGPIAIGI